MKYIIMLMVDESKSNANKVSLVHLSDIHQHRGCESRPCCLKNSVDGHKYQSKKNIQLASILFQGISLCFCFKPNQWQDNYRHANICLVFFWSGLRQAEASKMQVFSSAVISTISGINFCVTFLGLAQFCDSVQGPVVPN